MRRTTLLAIFGCVIYLGWHELPATADDTILLHTVGVGSQDRYAVLWVVEEGSHLWIRAESPRRRWLEPLRVSDQVRVSRDGRTARYRPSVVDTPEARAFVARSFREKYGLADRVRAVLGLGRRGAVPIRLDPL